MIKMRHILGLALFFSAAAAWAEPQASFDRYQPILDRKPFGNPPVAPPEPEVVIPPEQSFARTIRMSALVEQDDGTIRVGLIDSQSNKSYLLAEGETENGIELVSADYENEEAVLRKGSEMAVIKLSSGEIQALSPQQQQDRMNAPRPQRMSYAERRAAREQARREAPPQPKYTGEELEKHLQEYQMEVIRNGLPPLPIPLTPEMDDQLVREGVLPPVQ